MDNKPNGVVKITGVISPGMQGYRRKRVYRENHCKLCGALLTSENSKKTGYGHKCRSKNIMLVLEIIPDVPQQTENIEEKRDDQEM